MRLNYMEVVEQGPIIHVYTPQGIEVGQILLPPDNQYTMNYKYMEAITEEMAIRWGIIRPKRSTYKS